MNFHAIENNNQKEKLLGDIYDNKKPLVSAPDKPEYAYAFEWSDYYSPKALYNILDKGLLARVAMNPFIGSTKKGSHNFDRGTIVVSFDRQDASENDIHNIMRDIAQDDGIFVHSLTSGKSVTGTQNPDLGSQFIKAIHKPTILLVAGREMDWYNVGEIWHLLDVRMNIPVTLIDRLQMNNIDLNRYTHIIYAGGQYSNYQPKYLNNIHEWVNSGGTLIGIRQGADWISKNIFNKNTDKSPKRFSKEKANNRRNKERDAMKKDQPRYSYSEKEARDPLNVIGGAIFSGDLDITHPIGFGYTNENIAIHKNTTSLLPTSKNPYATVIAYNDAPIISGYASETNQEKLKNTPALIADRRGKGSIILFADDPNFRATWYGTNKLFLNSLFFSLVFDPPRNN